MIIWKNKIKKKLQQLHWKMCMGFSYCIHMIYWTWRFCLFQLSHYSLGRRIFCFVLFFRCFVLKQISVFYVHFLYLFFPSTVLLLLSHSLFLWGKMHYCTKKHHKSSFSGFESLCFFFYFKLKKYIKNFRVNSIKLQNEIFR